MTPDERVELIEAVTNALWNIRDADELTKIALVTGFSVEEIRDLGGLE